MASSRSDEVVLSARRPRRTFRCHRVATKFSAARSYVEPDGRAWDPAPPGRSARRRRISAFGFPSREFNPCPCAATNLQPATRIAGRQREAHVTALWNASDRRLERHHVTRFTRQRVPPTKPATVPNRGRTQHSRTDRSAPVSPATARRAGRRARPPTRFPADRRGQTARPGSAWSRTSSPAPSSPASQTASARSPAGPGRC